MADYRKEIEEILRKTYKVHDYLQIVFPDFDDYVTNLFSDTGLSYEAISEMIQEEVDAGKDIEIILAYIESGLTKKK